MRKSTRIGVILTVAIANVSLVFAALVLTTGSSYTFESDGGQNVATTELSSTGAVLFYRDVGDGNDGLARIATVDGTTITYGNVATVSTNRVLGLNVENADSSTVVFGYVDDITADAMARVGTISGTDITLGTAKLINTDSGGGAHVAAISSTKLLIAYHDNANSDGRAVIGTISGTDITLGTPAMFEANNSYVQAVIPLSSSYAAILYTDSTDSYIGHIIIVDVSGATPSFGSATEITTDTMNNASMAALDSTTFVVAYRDATGNNGKARAVTISGTTPTVGSAVTFDASTIQSTALAGIDATTVLLAFRDSVGALGNGTSVIGTVDGTTLTFGSPFVYESNSTNSNGLAALSSSAFLVAYENGTTSVGDARIISYAEEVVSSNSPGGAQAHKRIRERYAEIAAGLHSSAEDMTDTDEPSLEDVGIFKSTMKTISPLPPVLVTTGALETEEPARISRLHSRIALMKAAPELVVATEELAQQEPEKSPFQQRVCTRVQKRFVGNALIRVEARLQKTFGWSC